MKNLFSNTFDGLNILLTGHTGFKGSWLSIWLKEMGAKVTGFSLPELPTVPCNFELSRLEDQVADIRGDIRDLDALVQTIETSKPSIVIHFAAQTTVLSSYENPKLSFDTNTGGTVNVLEAVRRTDSVRALVVCTTDKVYENKEWIWGYRENDELGGYDPYSTGKAMAELAVASYRRSFFSGEGSPSKQKPAVGSVRAGNVIGGGDFTENGLLADSMRSIFKKENIYLRNPSSTRPWQYVLEPISGYLCVAERLLHSGHRFAQAWNFGPLQHSALTTLQIVEKLLKLWDGDGSTKVVNDQTDAVEKLHEAQHLHLNWDKSASLLGWRPVFDVDEALTETVQWYREYQAGTDMYPVGLACIERYVERARQLGLSWAGGKPVVHTGNS